LNTAIRLRDFRNDDAAAAKVLDSALARKQEGTQIELARFLAARIELAVISDEHDLARSLYVQFKNLELSENDRQLLSDDIAMLEKLESSFK
jgi:ribonucleotide reductase alpha subunit